MSASDARQLRPCGDGAADLRSHLSRHLVAAVVHEVGAPSGAVPLTRESVAVQGEVHRRNRLCVRLTLGQSSLDRGLVGLTLGG
jgi:uncharacterized protein YdiU (UPF0061 family)